MKITALAARVMLFCFTIHWILYHYYSGCTINSQGLVFGTLKLQLSVTIFHLFYKKNRKFLGNMLFYLEPSFIIPWKFPSIHLLSTHTVVGTAVQWNHMHPKLTIWRINRILMIYVCALSERWLPKVHSGLFYTLLDIGEFGNLGATRHCTVCSFKYQWKKNSVMK